MNDETNKETEQAVEEESDIMTKEGEGAAEGEVAAEEGEGAGEEAEAVFDEASPDIISPDGAEDSGDEDDNIGLIMDLPLQVVVELGRTRMLINDLLQIGQGSVIELNKQVGEALDVLVNGKIVARGEVVVVKDKFGVRISEVVSTIERIKQLG
jgi:flagellar motor switch protein FliN/FliY